MQLEQHCRETAELFGAINELWHAAEPGDHHQRRCLVMTAHCTQMLVVWMVEQADLVDELAGCPLRFFRAESESLRSQAQTLKRGLSTPIGSIG